MKKLRNKRLAIPLGVLVFFILHLIFYTTHKAPLNSTALANNYRDTNINELSAQMDQFAARGAAGFLIWQYSGSLHAGETFGADQYGFFQHTDNGSAVCSLLAEKSGSFEFVGVNMWDLGDPRYSQDLIQKHFRWLRDECGVKVIRTFAKVGEAAGMRKVLAAANAEDLQIIIAIGDYSNGGGGIPAGAGAEWYRSGYDDHLRFSQEIAAAVSNHPALYALELANEPHCAGQPPETINYYTDWGRVVGGAINSHSQYVGYGQMADPNGVCDSPYSNGFRTSNSISEINITSAHYYNQIEYEASLDALEISKTLGKKFYIGEANFVYGADTRPRSDFIRKDPEDYNFFPLINPDSLDDAAGGSLRDRFLESLAKDQGYEVHCAAPQWYISSTEHRFDMAERYFELVVPNWGSQHTGPPAENVIEFTGQGEYIINLANSKVPLYRGQEATQYTQKISSYEGFFGTVDNLHPYFAADGTSDEEGFRPLESENNPVIYTGTAENLLSSFQQCKYKMGNLETVDYICQRVAGACYLDTIIPNTNYRRWQLRGELFDLMNNCGFEKCLDCADLTGPYDEEKLSHLLDEDKFYDLKHALKNLSMDIDNLYRVAFLVIAPGQNKDLADTSGDWDRDFFYSHNAIEHHPMIIAFKIPDFLTNRSRFEYSAKPTADSVRSETQQEISLQKIDERRDGIYKEAKEMARKADKAGQNAEFAKEFMQEAVIYCPSLGICLDSDDPDTALKSAVISIINGAGSKSCPGGMPWEDAGDIYTLGRLSVEGDRQFDQDHGAFSDALTRTQRTNFNWGLRVVDTNWRDDFGRNFFNHFEEGNNQKIPVNAYIVAPLGVTQDEIYEALKFQFTPDQYEKMVEGNYLVDAEMEGVVPEYLPLKDVEFGIEEDRDMFNFIDYEDPQTRDVPLIDPDTGQPIRDLNGEIIMTTEIYYPEKEFGRGMEEERPERLLIYGAKVGWMMRKIQESITTAASPLYEYLQSCERVEDMLLGRCGGGDGSRQYGPPGDPWSGGGGTGKCEPINDPDNHCDVNRLKDSLAQYIRSRRGLSPGDSLPISDAELTRRATQASIICNAESGGNPNARNLSCLGGGSVDYSVGLFQINLLAHVCPEYFNYTWEPPWCQILVSQDRVDQCVATVIEPERNKQEAWRISGAGSNWNAWATAKDEHCGPDLRAVP